MYTVEMLNSTEWIEVARFDPCVVNLDTIKFCAYHIAREFEKKVTFARRFAVIDQFTGEVIWERAINCS